MPLLHKIRTYRFHSLLVCTLLYILVSPMLTNILALKLLSSIFITLMLVSGIFAVSQRKAHLLIGVLLAMGMFVPTWSLIVGERAIFGLLSEIFGILFFAFTTWSIVSFIFRSYDINAEVICGSIVVYLLLAILWSFIYAFLERIHPGSFSVATGHTQGAGFLFLYYSLVTITTLGYGDVTPLTDTAGAFAIVEAVTGQLYIAVLIARLVGVHVAQSTTRAKRNDDDKR